MTCPFWLTCCHDMDMLCCRHMIKSASICNISQLKLVKWLKFWVGTCFMTWQLCVLVSVGLMANFLKNLKSRCTPIYAMCFKHAKRKKKKDRSCQKWLCFELEFHSGFKSFSWKWSLERVYVPNKVYGVVPEIMCL